ncbi:MAG: GMC family oxidoreductase N-terminal domain-containing protein, partial [Alphaproteobacteria bacterium]|nr:GMC family oxidoreductase N-terminal domain-containing protein [Alphaproteobacteria bacterium]
MAGDASDPTTEDLGTFDYVIVGAGSAGCVLANRLSADPDVSVLLLEAGGRDDYFWIKIPVGYLFTIDNPRTDWRYRTEAEAGLNGRALGYPRGRTLGGCSSINAMIYMRGQARDYDTWRQMGNAGWGWDDVLPYFKKSEDYAPGADDLHGGGGEWRVEEARLSWEILDAFRQAAAECGIAPTDDFNRGDNEGCGYFKVNQRRGVRVSTARAFLHPVASRRNLTVVTHAQVERLIFDGKRATGLRLKRNGVPARAQARGEVILSSGSIGSPQILQLSGIGAPDLLKGHGIDVVQVLPGVGENLQDHLQLRMIYKVSGAITLNQQANSLVGKARMGLEYFLFKRGPLTMAPSQLGAFTRSDASFETANLEYHIQPLSLDKFGDPLHDFPAFTASVCNLRPESRGHVRIKSADPADHPAIAPNYLSAEADRRVAVVAIKLTRRIAAAEALRRYAPEEYLPGAQAQSDDDLARAAGDIGTTIFHPVGTCKMGGDSAAVVDARLRVR